MKTEWAKAAFDHVEMIFQSCDKFDFWANSCPDSVSCIIQDPEKRQIAPHEGRVVTRLDWELFPFLRMFTLRMHGTFFFFHYQLPLFIALHAVLLKTLTYLWGHTVGVVKSHPKHWFIQAQDKHRKLWDFEFCNSLMQFELGLQGIIENNDQCIQ